MDVLKIIWNKNEVCNTGFGCTVDDSYNWFYTEKILYFLEDNNRVDKEITDENSMEYKSFTNVHNLGEKKKDYKVKKNGLWDHFNDGIIYYKFCKDLVWDWRKQCVKNFNPIIVWFQKALLFPPFTLYYINLSLNSAHLVVDLRLRIPFIRILSSYLEWKPVSFLYQFSNLSLPI